MKKTDAENLKVLLVSSDEQDVQYICRELDAAFQVDIVSSIEDCFMVLDGADDYNAVVVDADDNDIPDLELLEEPAYATFFDETSLTGITRYDLGLSNSGFTAPKWMNVMQPDELISWLNTQSEETPYTISGVA